MVLLSDLAGCSGLKGGESESEFVTGLLLREAPKSVLNVVCECVYLYFCKLNIILYHSYTIC